MSKINDIKEMFNEIEGIQILENESGEIQDIILPSTCNLITKSVINGTLQTIEFLYGNASYHFEK